MKHISEEQRMPMARECQPFQAQLVKCQMQARQRQCQAPKPMKAEEMDARPMCANGSRNSEDCEPVCAEGSRYNQDSGRCEAVRRPNLVDDVRDTGNNLAAELSDAYQRAREWSIAQFQNFTN